MIVNIKNKETNARYLQVDAGVRYYEDTVVDGVDDISLYDSKGDGEPFVPCVVKIKDKPTSCIYSDHYRWKPLIDVSNGQIVNWRKGTTADVHYKVCDEGVYCLLNNNKQQIIRIESYVPTLLDPYGNGYGDYIIFSVDADGYIKDWNFNQELVDNLIKGDFNYKEDCE